MIKKTAALFISLILLAAFIPATAHAATYTVSSGTVNLSGYADGDIIQVSAGSVVTITGSKRVQIQCGSGVTLTLSNVTVNISSGCALSFTGSGNILKLRGTNTLKSYDNEPGIRVESGSSLEITDDGLDGEDYLYVTGGSYSAGIGGGNNDAAGTITISGGNITANGDYSGDYNGGAGIGGGNKGGGGNITISSGTVTASSGTGDDNASAAIGSGTKGIGGTITISGGTVNATSNKFGAAIGSGGDASGAVVSSINSITISGGVINAISTYYGTAIGGGIVSHVGNITISGGTINAQAQNCGAGIGAGDLGDADTINITGGTVTAIGGEYSAGIGCSYQSYPQPSYISSVNTINISGGTVTATGGKYSAGIGGAYGPYCTAGTINITGGDVTATGGDNSAGIGCGYNQSSLDAINITGGTVTATGGENAAGIGSDNSDNMSGNIAIKSGIVFAEGSGSYDIGYVSDSSIVDIYGDTKVFSNNNTIQNLTTTSHYNFDFKEAVSGKVYGVTIPASWSGAYSYLLAVTLNYDDNGGSGTKSETVPKNNPIIVGDSGGFSFTGYTFSEWNSAIDGSGTPYDPGDQITPSSDLTLYAIWNPITSTSLTLSSHSETLSIGETSALVATISPADSADKTITWQSTDTAVATVNSSGVITAVGVGDTAITATNGTASDTCDVTVYQPVTSVDIDADSLSLNVGGTGKLNAALLPSNAKATTVYWTSSDGKVASVDGTGLVTVTGIGTATITATAGGISDTCTVTVGKKAVTKVDLNYGFKNMYIGEWFVLKATVSPSDATNPAVTWHSSDTSVATVTNGVVEAVGDGSCTITATADGEYAECPVSVGTKAVTSISLDYSSQKLYEGGVFVLTATVLPDDAADPTVTWTSSDGKVASVNKNGIVTAIGEGSATIKATAGSQSDTCKVTVLPEPEVDVDSVNIFNKSGFTAILYVGDSLNLSAHVSPTDATYSNVIWSSSDSSVASVTSSGQVTAKSEGSAAITAAAGGKTATYSITVKAYEDPGQSPAETPAPGETPAPADAPTPVIEKTVVREAVVAVKLDTTRLPEGTKYIKLPGGEIIELNGEETMNITVPEGSINGDGTIELIALNDEQVPVGSVEAEPVYKEDTGNPYDTPFLKMLVILLGGLVVGAAGALFIVRLVITKRRL